MANSIMSNVTMDYDLVRKIHLLVPINAKSLNEFVVMRIALLLIKLEHLPFVDIIVGHLIFCIQ